MTGEEATQLARRFKGCWNWGPAFEDWFDVLEPLDQDKAWTTYRRLQEASDQAPSIATFKATYRTVATYAADDAEDCPDCDNTGFVLAAPLELTPERKYTQVKPCRCGRAA